MDTTPVATIQEFKKKYGTKTPGLLIGKFIKLAPEFPPETKEQGRQLVRELGILAADLEVALRDVEAFRAE